MTNEKMFCYQCEQTAGCTGCTGAKGVCGKTAKTAALQDKLTGALIGLALSAQGNEDILTRETYDIIIEGLFATLTNVSFDVKKGENNVLCFCIKKTYTSFF